MLELPPPIAVCGPTTTYRPGASAILRDALRRVLAMPDAPHNSQLVANDTPLGRLAAGLTTRAGWDTHITPVCLFHHDVQCPPSHLPGSWCSHGAQRAADALLDHDPWIVVAFPLYSRRFGSPVVWHTVDSARELGIPVMVAPPPAIH